MESDWHRVGTFRCRVAPARIHDPAGGDGPTEAYKYNSWFAQGCLARIGPERERWALNTDEVRDWLATSREMKVETDEPLPLEVKPARRYRP